MAAHTPMGDISVHVLRSSYCIRSVNHSSCEIINLVSGRRPPSFTLSQRSFLDGDFIWKPTLDTKLRVVADGADGHAVTAVHLLRCFIQFVCQSNADGEFLIFPQRAFFFPPRPFNNRIY